MAHFHVSECGCLEQRADIQKEELLEARTGAARFSTMSSAAKKKTPAPAKTPKAKLVRARAAKFSEIRSALNLRRAEAYKIHKHLLTAGK